MSALSILLFAVLVWYGARRPEVTVSEVIVEGGSTVPHVLVREKVESALSGSYALLIPKRFSFLLPLQAIQNAVNTVPRVHDATVVRTSLTVVKVSFEEHVPYALWCEHLSDDASSTPASCVFVDESGYAFAEAPQLSGETLVRFVVEGRPPSIGESVYDAATLSEYRALISAIKEEHDDRLRAMTETKDGDLVLHLSLGPDLRITKASDVHDIFESLESILSAPEYKDVSLADLEYIDLRFGNKVYVKRRGIDPTPVTREEAASSTPSE